MAGYRKLSRTASQRKALLRGQVTSFLYNGKMVTTESKAKEVQKIAEGLIAMAVKEKDNFEVVKVKAKVVEELVKGDKVRVIRYKSKKRVHKEMGHRQKYSLIEVTSIK